MQTGLDISEIPAFTCQARPPVAEGEARGDCLYLQAWLHNPTGVNGHGRRAVSQQGGNGGIACIDGYCDVISSANQQGVCVAAAELGEECYGGSCAPGLECTEAGCQPESL